jgi:probable phosphoglycerate mutase
MELLLIRHALPVRVEDAGGRADPELSEIGHRQAEALARWLTDETVDAIYASPMRRARQTAEPLARTKGLEVVVDEELAEFDRDAHFYIPMEELKAEKDPRWQMVVDGKLGEDGEVDPETFRAVVHEAMERVIDACPSQRVAVVCHGGVINAYLSRILGIDRVMFFEPIYTGISRVMAARSGERSLVSVNEAAHLKLFSTQ